jgi:uncharacterized protein (UPF0332 family)
VNPRSAELLELARRRLAQARVDLEAGFPDGAISAAYYAMLAAARAALSERERNARTHSGTWHLFHDEFVVAGGFDQELFAEAPRAQQLRWASDYEGEEFSADEARDVIDAAERFLAAVEAEI